MFKNSRILQRHILPYWKTLVVVLTPLALLPLPLLVDGPEARAGYGVLLMTIFWLTSALPLAVTSLLPIVVFPLMDTLSTAQVCAVYFKESNVIFLGGVVLALGVERSNLHRRIALRVILTVGTNPRWLMLGFMSVGMLLSMWISNSGVTAMLIPIVDAVVDELFTDVEQGAMMLSSSSEKEQLSQDDSESAVVVNKDKRRIRTAMMLSISYASSMGGAATLIGSGAPMAFNGILEDLYGQETGLSFASFMAIGFPVAVINTILTWLWLQIIFMGLCCSSRSIEGLRSSRDIKMSIRNQYRQLGPTTFYERSIMFLFSLLILLWIFKDPQFMPGWENAFPLEYRIGDATVCIAIVILAFILPAKLNFWCFSKAGPDEEVRPSPALLDWNYVQQKFPWNVLLLLGGGYAISDASKVSGLSLWMGSQLSVLGALPPIAVMILMCLLASLITEVASNTATASILLPIVAQMGVATKLNPLYLMIPVTITCCYAFMLPVGTPCNAMVFSAGKLKLPEMIKAGAVMNVFSILVICAVMETIGVPIFDLYELPDWLPKKPGLRPTFRFDNNVTQIFT